MFPSYEVRPSISKQFDYIAKEGCRRHRSHKVLLCKPYFPKKNSGYNGATT